VDKKEIAGWFFEFQFFIFGLFSTGFMGCDFRISKNFNQNKHFLLPEPARNSLASTPATNATTSSPDWLQFTL
jgi:hypothetical protein